MRFKPNIVWNPKCVPEFVNTFSPSWKKPREFVSYISDYVDRDGVVLHQSESVGSLMETVHNKNYLKGVLSGAEATGFGVRDAKVAESCLYTAGAMVEGVNRATEGYSTCAPVSGFHHAGWDFGGGFCTFNGLALAATVARGFGLQPGIVDLDMHYGNGTVSILTKLGIEDIPHYTFGGTTYAGRGKGDAFVKMLPRVLARAFGKCKILLYQAGADPHVDDPLGGALTTEQMKERDEIVFRFAKEQKIPVVWCLAGGYQPDLKKVLALHEQTYNAWLRNL